MTSEIDNLISSLQKEISNLSPSPTEDTIKTITQQLQDLCSKLATNQEDLSDQTKHTFHTLKDSLAASTIPSIQALAQSYQLTDLFKTVLYSSKQSQTSQPSPAVLKAIAGYHHPLTITPPKPLQSNSLNEEQVKLWLAAHPEQVRETLKATIKSITHISQSEFEKAFTASVQSFNDRIEKDLKGKGTDQDYVALTWTHKSQEWMLEIALPQLSVLPKEVLNFENLQSEIAYCLENKIPLQKIAIFDDGIYSGSQIQSIIGDITNIYFDLQLPIPKFYIICPFITEEGHKSTEKYQQLLMNSMTFSDYQTIPSFHKEMLKQPNGQKLWKNLIYYLRLNNHPYLECLSPYYFDHKIPDKTSSLISFFADGLVRNIKGEIILQNGQPLQFPLIPRTISPYHIF